MIGQELSYRQLKAYKFVHDYKHICINTIFKKYGKHINPSIDELSSKGLSNILRAKHIIEICNDINHIHRYIEQSIGRTRNCAFYLRKGVSINDFNYALNCAVKFYANIMFDIGISKRPSED